VSNKRGREVQRDPDRAELALILDVLGVTGSPRNAALSLHGLGFGLCALDIGSAWVIWLHSEKQ
jgi:hypothetical protein